MLSDPNVLRASIKKTNHTTSSKSASTRRLVKPCSGAIESGMSFRGIRNSEPLLTGVKSARFKEMVSLWLARRGFLTYRRVQTQSRAHAFLPGTLFDLAFFDLSQGGAQWFAAELAHLDIEQRRHDRDQRQNEDI